VTWVKLVEYGGGGDLAGRGTYDPQLNLLYWTTGKRLGRIFLGGDRSAGAKTTFFPCSPAGVSSPDTGKSDVAFSGSLRTDTHDMGCAEHGPCMVALP
jgi:hypothetical protein